MLNKYENELAYASFIKIEWMMTNFFWVHPCVLSTTLKYIQVYKPFWQITNARKTKVFNMKNIKKCLSLLLSLSGVLNYGKVPEDRRICM